MLTGTRIADRYTIVRSLGRGGMGEVYAATDEKFGSPVAVKVARASGALADDFRARFIREARLGHSLGRLDGIVHTLDWGEIDESTLYLAMDLVEGARPLDLATGTVVERLGRLASAARLAALVHERGVVHRDLKPTNFLVDVRGKVWLGDFGVAKAEGMPDEVAGIERSSLTQASSGLGTPAYMSPEQFEDARSVDARADVYSLGVMLFFALTARLPYEGSATSIVKHQEKVKESREPAPAPRTLVPGVAESLDSLCRRAIDVDAAQRISSAASFAQALEAAARGETVAVAPRAHVVRHPEPTPAPAVVAPSRDIAPSRDVAPVPTPARAPWLLLSILVLPVVGFGILANTSAHRETPTPSPYAPNFAPTFAPAQPVPSPTPPELQPVASPTPSLDPDEEPAARAERLALEIGPAIPKRFTDMTPWRNTSDSPPHRRVKCSMPAGHDLILIRVPNQDPARPAIWLSQATVSESEISQVSPATAKPSGLNDLPAHATVAEARAYARWAGLSLLEPGDVRTPGITEVLWASPGEGPEWVDSDKRLGFVVGHVVPDVTPQPADARCEFRVIYRERP